MKERLFHAMLFTGYLFISLYFLIAALASCSHGSASVHDTKKENNVPYIRIAERFSLEKVSDYTEVRVYNPWQGAVHVVQEWYLIHRGKAIPEGIDSSEVIRVPVRKIVCMSTTHLAMIYALGEASTVKGFSGTRFVYNKEIRDMIVKGLIHEIGYDNNLNKELILDLNPDLVMIYGVGSESAGYIEKLKELGIKVFYNADYLETVPLGKTEWIKLFGALYCKEQVSDSLFNKIETEYSGIKNYINENTKNYPSVMLGLPYRDTWYLSPGNSYISKLIGDAGGTYLWKDTRSSAAFPVNLETVYLKAMNADFWLNTGTAESREDIISTDKRLSDLDCFRKDKLFNNNKRMSDGGGNDYWESGSVNPQVILEDIATILHPDLFPGRELIYYKNLQ